VRSRCEGIVSKLVTYLLEVLTRLGNNSDCVICFKESRKVSVINALSSSVAILGGIWTYLTILLSSSSFPLQAWVIFISWACYFAVGAGKLGLQRTLASNIAGIMIASTGLFLVGRVGGGAIVAAIIIGLASGSVVQFSRVPILSQIPAIVLGFASVVGTVAATGFPLTSASISNPILIAITSAISGAATGYISEIFASVLAGRKRKRISG